MWSIGCVIAEIILGQPIFPGESALDQIVEIIKIIGTPTKQQIELMNPEYKDEYKFPLIKPYPWTKVYKNKNVTDDFIDFISKLLCFEPEKRAKPLQILLHPFFDELRAENATLPSGKPIQNLFNFTKEETNYDPESVSKLIPIWYKE